MISAGLALGCVHAALNILAISIYLTYVIEWFAEDSKTRYVVLYIAVRSFS